MKALIIVLLALTLAACGGGGGGERGEIPMEPGLQQPGKFARGFTRDNFTAQDIMDHWNQPEQLRQALGLTPVGEEDRAARMAALTALDEDLDTHSVELLGERNGITYARWTGGPSGTFNIEFDYRFAPEATREQRARIERAGKSWSWRLADESRTYTIEAGRQVAGSTTADDVPLEALRVDEDITTDGLVIFVDFHAGTRRSRGGPSISSRSARERGDFHPYAGKIRIGTPRFDEVHPKR